jgi:hypothetical protein
VSWPWWAKTYAILIGIPMIGVSLGTGVWLVTSRIDGLLTDRPTVALYMLMSTIALTFGFAAWLFYAGIVRVFTGKTEALNFTATAHLLLGVPAMVLLVALGLRNHKLFLDDLTFALSQRDMALEFRLMIWMAFHMYLAVLLSFADNTGDRLADGPQLE